MCDRSLIHNYFYLQIKKLRTTKVNQDQNYVSNQKFYIIFRNFFKIYIAPYFFIKIIERQEGFSKLEGHSPSLRP